jgi:hypothetical protein
MICLLYISKLSNVKSLIYMKTYIFILVLTLLTTYPSFAAQDETYAQINSIHPVMYAMTLDRLKDIQTAQANQLSWKEKVALKIITKKLAKAERKVKQGKKANFVGGLIAFIIIGAIFIPIGILFLVPLLILGVLLLALGIFGSVFRGIGRIFW